VGHDDRSTTFELDPIDIPSSTPPAAPQRIDRQFKFVSGLYSVTQPAVKCHTAWRAALKIPYLRPAIAVLDLENGEGVGTHIPKFLHSPDEPHRILLVEHRNDVPMTERNTLKAQLLQTKLPGVVSYATAFQLRPSGGGPVNEALICSVGLLRQLTVN
jgi:hypothetical protein